MTGTPNTVGLLLLFLAIFFVCILWATHGHTADADSEQQDIGAVGKES